MEVVFTFLFMSNNINIACIILILVLLNYGGMSGQIETLQQLNVMAGFILKGFVPFIKQ